MSVKSGVSKVNVEDFIQMGKWNFKVKDWTHLETNRPHQTASPVQEPTGKRKGGWLPNTWHCDLETFSRRWATSGNSLRNWSKIRCLENLSVVIQRTIKQAYYGNK